MSNIDFFNKNKYCLVNNALDKNICSIATLYSLIKEKTSFDPEKDNKQSPGMHGKYADSLMESILYHLSDVVSKNIGLDVAPSYSYYRIYRNGSELKKHTDRKSCEISATLCLGYNYNDENGSWPIFIDDNAYSMEPGDMIIYRGSELIHWRNPFYADEDAFHAQLFLHYVDKNGPFSDFELDKRPYIGYTLPPEERTLDV